MENTNNPIQTQVQNSTQNILPPNSPKNFHPVRNTLIILAALAVFAAAGSWIYFSQKIKVTVAVTIDQNENGVADPNEPLLQNLSVSIQSNTGDINVIKNSGPFEFKNLPRFARQNSLLPKPVLYDIHLSVAGDCLQLSHQSVTYRPGASSSPVKILAVYSCISGTAFLDTVGNGKRAGQKPVDYISQLAYSRLILTPDGGGVSAISTELNADGAYSFRNIPRFAPAIYPENKLIRYTLSSSADCYRTTGVGKPIIFNSSPGTDVGLAYSCLSGIAYHDRNGNGKIDSGDDALSNATVQLALPDQSGTMATATADNAGKFLFKNLDFSDYNVTVNKQYFSAVTPQPVLVHLDPNLQLKIGMSCSCVEGWVYLDSNSNLTFDADEKGVPNIGLGLGLADGQTWSAKTDANGYYIIPNLKPNSKSRHYLLAMNPGLEYEEVDLRQDTSFDIPPDALINFAVRPRTDNQVFKGRVYLAGTGNGIPGVSVSLFRNGSGASGPTKFDGSFEFQGNYSGYYTLSVKLPQGYTAPQADSGGFINQIVDIEPNMAPVDIAVSATSTPQAAADQNSNYKVFGSIFNDLNSNGKKDPGEPALSSFVVSMQAWDDSTNNPQAANFLTYMDTNQSGIYSTDSPEPQFLPAKTPKGGVYHISAIDPRASQREQPYIPTTPADLFFMLNADREIDFGFRQQPAQ